MATDLRQKACANDACSSFKKKKYSASYEHCPVCGQKLIYVCASPNCYKPLNLNEPKHILCETCQAKYKDLKDNALALGKKYVVGPAIATVGVFAKKETRELVLNALAKVKDTLKGK